MTHMAKPSDWLWSILFVPQCIITNNVMCCKEISRPLHKTFSTGSPLIHKLRASLKEFFEICRYLLKPVAVESPIIMIGAAEFCESFLWNVCFSCHPSLCKCATGYLQLLVWLLLVKLRASLVIISVCVPMKVWPDQFSTWLCKLCSSIQWFAIRTKKLLLLREPVPTFSKRADCVLTMQGYHTDT